MTTVIDRTAPDGVSFEVRRHRSPRQGSLLKKWRLMVFVGLFLIGLTVGVAVFCSFSDSARSALNSLLGLSEMGEGLAGMASAMASACFLPLCLLVGLFVCGLSVCGIPACVLTPFFFGLGIGITEGFAYAHGWIGIAYVVLMVLPSALLTAATMVMACSESVRMSLLLTGQMSAMPAHASLKQDFLLYCVRFLIFLLLIVAAGMLRVLPRLLFEGWFAAVI